MIEDVEKETGVDGKKIIHEAKEQAIQKLEVKREIKKEIEDMIQERVNQGADKDEIEACIRYSQLWGIPVEKCL